MSSLEQAFPNYCCHYKGEQSYVTVIDRKTDRVYCQVCKQIFQCPHNVKFNYGGIWNGQPPVDCLLCGKRLSSPMGIFN